MVNPEIAESLPVKNILPAISQALAKEGCAVVQAPPGAGKTTLVPLSIQSIIAGRVILVEPRRLAAKAAASRMAALSRTTLGKEIGYQVRFDFCFGKETRLLAVTPGVLLNQMAAQPELPGVGAIILDEFHERGLENDLILGLVELVRKTLRPDLKILVMSATLNAQAVSQYLNNCPILISQGRVFPVEVNYQPRSFNKEISSALKELFPSVAGKSVGDVLVFLPGMGEILKAKSALANYQPDWEIHILHGDLSLEAQEKAICHGKKRKIILSTNVAESSVTVQGVSTVIDSGLARQSRQDTNLGLNHLELVPISKASADQRTGRAGREGPGFCYRLWSEAEHKNKEDFDRPEVARVNLAEGVLRLFALGESNLDSFPWFEKPPQGSLSLAIGQLEKLGAIKEGRITDLGSRMTGIPAHPRLARLLISGLENGCLPRACMAAALLSERSPFDRGMNARKNSKPVPGDSDLLEQVEVLEQFEATGRVADSIGNVLAPDRARSLLRIRDQFLRCFPGAKSPPMQDSHEGFLKTVLAGFPDRVAARRGAGNPRGLMVGCRGVQLSSQSVVQNSPLFICLDVEAGGIESKVWMASSVQRDWLNPAHLGETRELELDDKTGKIMVWRRLRYMDLLLEEKPAHLSPEDKPEEILFHKAKEKLLDYLPATETEGGQFLQRLRYLKQACPELGLPEPDPNWLEVPLRWVCQGKKSLGEIREGDWSGMLARALNHEQRRIVEKEAPSAFTMPKGRRAAVVYPKGGRPEISARIQDFFGLRETPRIALGKVAILLKLLAPNFRPQQVTDDLAGFWKNSYHLVRKDLRGRYPKHAWPENPLEFDGGKTGPEAKKQNRPK
ncbi:MAG: ATP-dependent helicase HrpB [Gemmataceae bacterium]|nr:ATP-dependent helicase HrpB [Gemmataceae bacterium]